jgi:murein DD-endopeptidase MepM/ murein hydrolase activator NlpD
LTQSGGGGGEYSLGTATLTLRGDMQPLERDLARMRQVIADMEKRGTNIPAPNIPPPSPEAQRGYEGLLKTLEQLRRGMQGDGEAFKALQEQLRGAGQAAGAAGGAGGFGGAGGALGGLLGMAGKAIPMLGQLGLAAAGIQSIFGGMAGAMAGAINAVLGPLQQLSAEAGRLNKQVAEAGIFAAQSFAILGPDGKLVEGTARQMQMVRGAILKEYKGIQQEVANISGATAREIYEGFNIVLSNISSLGAKGTTENAAKLATRIAAGMNTLGVPGYQLRGEVNALMMGNIGPDAMLAKKLGISGEDVRQQQAQGTYYDFLMGKLEKLYDGQKVLALSLANVKSNFDDVNEAISSEAGQPLERDTATMMQSILVTFKNLQQSFTGFFKSIAEAVGPVLKLFGPVVSILTSIGAAASSVGQIIMDVVGTVTAVVGGGLMPILTAVARTGELIARVVGLVAEAIGAVINPIKALFNVGGDTQTAAVSSFFDQMFTGLDKVSGAIDSFNQKWAAMVLNTSLVSLRANMKLTGKSEEEIQAAQDDMRDRYKVQTGLTDEVQLRSLKLPPNIANQMEEMNNRLGTGAERALNIPKVWSDIKQKAYQNEIKSLEQGVTLMNKQKEIAEAMAAVGNARRALVGRSYELGVQVAASPEARAAAEARLADLKLSQEKEAIAERRGILQTEKELQQRQMLIQQTQIKIQQEQLKIQVAEAQAEQVKVSNATQAVLKVRSNTSPRSPEWMAATRELNVLAAEQTRNNAKLAGSREALRLAFQAEAQMGTINGLEAQRLGLQEQQLDIQGQSAQYTREQQALMAQISAAEQEITNELTRATNIEIHKKQKLEAQTEEINRQIRLQDQQGRLEKARADLAATRAKAEVQAAQRLEEVQAAQDRARNGGGTASVIEAQIAAAAAGVTGMETAAEVQKRLYAAREQQMTREHALQQRQLEVQQKRELSEVRIQELQVRGQQVALAIQRNQLIADLGRLGLGRTRDGLSQQVAGASSVPRLGGVARLPGSISGRLDASGQNGADMPVGSNNEMRSYHNGVVAEISKAGNNGNYAVIKFVDDLGNKLEATYSHMAAIVKVGQQVVGGQVLGRFDGSGRTFGAHNSVDINSPGTNGALQRNAETAAARRSADLLVTGRVQGQVGGFSVGASAAPVLPPPNTNPKLLKAMQAAYGAGFRGENLIKMTAVAMAESTGDATETNMKGQDNSYGLWQINMKGAMGPERRKALGISSNEELLDPALNARAAKMLFDERGFQPWRNSYGNANYNRWIGQARAVAPSVMGGGGAAAGVSGGPVTSTANQEQDLLQALKDNNRVQGELAEALKDLVGYPKTIGNAQSLERENLTEQQLAERAQFEFEQRKALLTAEVMKTSQGQLGMAAGDAVSGSISGSLSGAMQALLNGGDVKQAVSSALAQAGQGLMQATMDALLNPLLAELQKGIFKTVTGVDVEALALQKAGGDLSKAAWDLSQAGVALAGKGGTEAAAMNFASNPFAIAGKLLGGVGGFSGAMGLDFGVPALTGIPDFSSAFTPGLAGGGNVQYGLDYLVGEKGSEIVRFNKDGGRVYSNRALTQALGIPFQRAPGGGAAVADGGGGDSLGVPFMAGSGSMPRAAGDSLGVPFMAGSMPRAAIGDERLGIPFLKTTGGNGGFPGASGGAGAGPAAMPRSAPIRLNVESQVINGVEYATIEQLREASAAAAQAGRDSAYDGMRNYPSIQRSLGMR